MEMKSNPSMFFGVDIAMQLLRPGAKYEITNTSFTRWEDPRPCPTWQEVEETLEKIKRFEESIPTIWLPEQLSQSQELNEKIEHVIGG